MESYVTRNSVLLLGLSLPLFLAPLSRAEADATQTKRPLYILPFMRFEDRLSTSIMDSRIRTTLGELTQLRKKYPEQPIKEVFQFSGAVADVLAEANPRTH